MSQTPRASRRVAFFGGSFDPPHLGHLAVARAARTALRLDEVLFAPVGAQPLKAQGATADFAHRVAMTRLAIAGEPGFSLSLADAPRPAGNPNYTVDTLHTLRAEMDPECMLFCLMGADSFLSLRKWRCAAEVPFAASLIVASRPGERLDELKSALPAGLTLMPAEEEDKPVAGVAVRTFWITGATGRRAPLYLLPGLDVEISASAIRAGMSDAGATGDSTLEGSPLPAAVRAYIRRHGLYRG